MPSGLHMEAAFGRDPMPREHRDICVARGTGRAGRRRAEPVDGNHSFERTPQVFDNDGILTAEII
jgi:hypothetical protein